MTTKKTPPRKSAPAPSRAPQRPSAPHRQAPPQRPATPPPRTAAPPPARRSDSFTVTGEVYSIGDLVQVSDKFSKRQLVLWWDDNGYPQTVAFEVVGRALDYLDSFAVGDTATVAFNLRGREWTSPDGEVKFFTTLSVWRIESPQADSRANDDIPF